MAVLLRSRFGLTVTALGAAFALAEVFDPQGSLYNVRLLPMWFISVYLMAGWTFGVGCILAARAWRRARQRRWERWEASSAAPAWVAAAGPTDAPAGADAPEGEGAAAAHAPRRTTPTCRPGLERRAGARRWSAARWSGWWRSSSSWSRPSCCRARGGRCISGPNEVTNWSNYNYQGYENQTSYGEYRGVIQAMEAVSKHYGCGRAMWEYSDTENRFGTPEALMLLPYWTSGCIDSMEGLLFESSATTPYHFINQAELSQGPSEPEVGLPYGPVDVALGVQHLQLLGVKYFMAETPEVEQQANADPSLRLVAKTGPYTYTYGGVLTHTTWDIYLVKNSGLVTPVAQRAGRALGRRPGAVGLARPVAGLVRQSRALERRAGAGRAGLVAAHHGR